MNNAKDWVSFEEWKALKEWTERQELLLLEYKRYGTRNGIYLRTDSEQQEQQGSNIERSLSLKDSRKMVENAGHTALLKWKERNNLLQDDTMYIPEGAAFSIVLSEPWDLARRSWVAFCQK